MQDPEPKPTHLEILNTTHEIWDAIIRDCEAAKHSIDLEQYILRDEIGEKLLKLFTQKALEGVRVRLLLDRIGSRSIFASPFIAQFTKAGGEIFIYNPITILNLPFPMTWFPRNHTKMTVIDSRIAYLGGACYADYMRDWRDLHVRITGDLVQDIVFIWDHVYGKKLKKLRQSWMEKPYQYVVSSPRMLQNPIYREIRHQIDAAQKSICIATPYFLPPLRLRRALRRAALRGVDVKIIQSEETDVPLAMRVSQSYFPRFLKNGLKIFLYQGTVFHAKYMVIDNNWATLGSSNIDYLSLLRNREANIIIRDPEMVARLRDNFEKDLAQTKEANQDFWHEQPPGAKLYGYIGRIFKKIL